MPRRPFATTLAAVLAVVCLAPSVAFAAEDAVPSPLPLTSGWQKLADPGNTGLTRELWRPANADAWALATVPSVFTGQTPTAAFKGTVGWYRVAFTAPVQAPGFSWDVHFEQVRRQAQVWLNGTKLGRHDDGYVPFDLSTAKALKPGERNVMVIRVDNRKRTNPREGWWNWGGITRPVTLIPRGALVLRDPGVLSDVDCSGAQLRCTAAVRFDGVLENHADHPIEHPQIRLALGDSASLTTVQDVRALAPGEQARVRFTMPVPEPRLWSPERPALYDVAITTSAGDRVQQVDRWKTGLREVKVKGGMLMLNGRQLDLRGASIQEDVPGRGPALNDADIAKIVQDLKAVHANVTRAHYLLNPKLLNALDAAGVMVWNQAPIYHRDVLLTTPAERDVALATVRGTILNARNHPAVITHSVANELSPIPDTVAGTRAFLGAAHAMAQDLDPTLPASVDTLSYPGYSVQSSYAQFPLLGINSYFGWYKGKANHSVAKLADLGPYLDRVRAQYPSQALVVTEFGAESTFSGPATEKETYAFQTDYLKQVLDIIEHRPFVGGAIYWTLQEFAVKPGWVGGVVRPVTRDAIHNKGLITYAGIKKPAWLLAARDFARTPLYRTVTPAAAAGVPTASDRDPGGTVLAYAAVALVLGLLALDGWALAGIMQDDRLRRRKPLLGTGRARAEAASEPAGARAA